MRISLYKLRRLCRQLRGRLNSPLPTGMPEFESWVASFITTYDLPTQDIPSIKNILASMIMNQGPTVFERPKHYFYVSLLSAASKQVASGVFYELQMEKNRRHAEAQAADAAEKAKLIEATTPPQVVADAQPQG